MSPTSANDSRDPRVVMPHVPSNDSRDLCAVMPHVRGQDSHDPCAVMPLMSVMIPMSCTWSHLLRSMLVIFISKLLQLVHLEKIVLF